MSCIDEEQAVFAHLLLNVFKMDQVYSNTRVPAQVNTNQH